MNLSSQPQNKSHLLATKIRREIEAGKWPPGGQLPPMRSLADRFHSNISTIQSAMRLLEGLGLVTCRSRQGAFVNEALPPPAAAEGPGGEEEGRPHIALIGTSLPRSGFDGWANRIQVAAEAALMEGDHYYLTHIGSSEPDPQRQQESLLQQTDELASRLAGAILFQNRPVETVQFMEKLDRLGVPWVSINHPTEQIVHNFVSADNIGAGRTAGRCFLLNGFEKILFLSPDMGGKHLSFTEKAMGLITAYIHADRPISGIAVARCGGYMETHGREAMLDYLRTHGVPQGVYATGDLIALGAMQALQEQGIDVPGQTSVIGSTGLEVARFSTPSLTVTPQPMAAMGRNAAQMLLRMIQTGERRLPGKQLNGGLILRDSLALSDSARQALIQEGLLRNLTPSSTAASAGVTGVQS